MATKKTATKDAKSDEAAAPKKGRGAAEIRTQIGRVVRIVFTVFAAVLVLGALLVALRDSVNGDNPVVAAILNFGDVIDGPFSRESGIFDFGGKSGETKNVLANWGLAAIIYLVLGRVLEKLIRP